jgi:hypothetical protein
MRHFLIGEFGPLPIAITRLACRLEPACSRANSIGGSGASERFQTLERRAPSTEPLSMITTPAQPQLHTTTPADREPVLFRHEAPCRRFLDMVLRM